MESSASKKSHRLGLPVDQLELLARIQLEQPSIGLVLNRLCHIAVLEYESILENMLDKFGRMFDNRILIPTDAYGSAEQLLHRLEDLTQRASMHRLSDEELEEGINAPPVDKQPTYTDLTALEFCRFYVKGRHPDCVESGPIANRVQLINERLTSKLEAKKWHKPITWTTGKACSMLGGQREITRFESVFMVCKLKSLQEILEQKRYSKPVLWLRGRSTSFRCFQDYWFSRNIDQTNFGKVHAGFAKDMAMEDLEYMLPATSMKLTPLEKLMLFITGGRRLGMKVGASLVSRRAMLTLMGGAVTLVLGAGMALKTYLTMDKKAKEKMDRMRTLYTHVRGLDVCSPLMDEVEREAQKEWMLTYHAMAGNGWITKERVHERAHDFLEEWLPEHCYVCDKALDDLVRIGACEQNGTLYRALDPEEADRQLRATIEKITSLPPGGEAHVKGILAFIGSMK